MMCLLLWLKWPNFSIENQLSSNPVLTGLGEITTESAVSRCQGGFTKHACNSTNNSEKPAFTGVRR
ncbi:hypothetical protein [Microseira wollei]|uniref:hypothetical protein n=1 Tax=Microseira wollei TaxID=467598 RepID=UPI001CFF29D8|nr:hypothetical protein [Microseira wollei]